LAEYFEMSLILNGYLLVRIDGLHGSLKIGLEQTVSYGYLRHKRIMRHFVSRKT